MIGQASEAAPNTGELALIRTIPLINVTAGRTSARCVTGVYEDYRHTNALGLICHEGAQLKEGPTMQPCSLTAASRYPVTNARQIFESNAATGVLRRLHKLLGYAVIRISDKASFLAGQLFETAMTGLRTFALQLRAQATMTKTHVLNCFTLMHCSIRISGNIDEAQVNAEKVTRFNLWQFLNVATLMQIEFTIAVDQIAFAAQALQKLTLWFATDEGHFLTSGYRPDRNSRRSELIGHQMSIERKSTINLEYALRLVIQLVGVGNFPKDTYCYICAKIKLLTHRTIVHLLQGKLSEGAHLPSLFADIITGDVRNFYRAQERGTLFGTGIKLYLSN